LYNSIYPTYVQSYLGVNNRQIVKRKTDDEKKSQSSQSSENETLNQNTKSKGASYFPNGEKVAIDYTKRQINIEQVLSDFKNTTNAIGAPDEIKSEVNSYLDLITSQSQKEKPNQQIIQSNLKNASQILDEYITNTLKKPSKVVENWVDALFMQKINYKAQPKENTIVQNQTEYIIPETESEVTGNIVTQPQNELENQQSLQPQPQETDTQNKSGIYIPSDPQLKRMFIQAKKYAAIDNSDKALSYFENTMDYAKEIGDEQTCAMINYEKGLIYDKSDNIEEALSSYNNAAEQSNDNNIKAKSHILMGRIYDDYVKFEPAFDHYCAAASYAGEADNLKLQTQAFSNLAQIHAERYDSENAMTFMELADITAEETNDKKVTGLISAKNAKNCEKLNETAKALKYYGDSAKSYSDLGDDENLAKRYQSAAQIMLQYGNRAKAGKLYSKAYIAAQRTDNKELKAQLTEQIASLSPLSAH